MDYKEKYEQALEWMRSLYDGLHGATKEDAEHYFPELTESEDERVRKGLITAVSGIIEGSKLFGTDVTREEALTWLEKQGENKSVDKPKFKVGDWIIFNGAILHIDEVINGYYRTTSKGDGIHNSYDWNIDNVARLWTIAEAKDGDVLYLQHEGVEHIIIYKRLVKKNFHTILSVHCAYDGSTKDFFEDVDHYHCITSERDEKEIHPATKEQRDTLERSMTNAGYKWNKEKLKLEKI